MADRLVKVILRGEVGDLVSKMRVAGSSVAKAADEMTGAGKSSVAFRRNLTELGDTAGKVGLVAAAGVGLAVKRYADFDAQMSKVRAATHATKDTMDDLRAAAIELGADTQFSATEAGDGIEQLAKAGVSAQDILGGGLKGALDLAAAGELEVGEAAETAATALVQFKLEGQDVPHVADLLAAAAGKAQGDVSDMAQALKQGGLVASQMGLSLEETTGALGAFASAGLLGSDAGTSFKTMLSRLTPDSDKAAEAMSDLGINAFDAQGNFIGLADFAGQLQTAMADLSPQARASAMDIIFGSDAVRAANVLYEEGADGVAEWIGKVDDAGYAAETAAIKTDNLKGDLERLGGAFDSLLIGMGEGADGPLREMVQGLTKVIDTLNALPGPVKQSLLALAGLTALTGGGLWFGSKVINSVADTRAALTDLGWEAGKTREKLGDLGRSGLDTITGQARGAAEAFGEMSNKQLALRGAAGAVGLLAMQMNTLDDSTDRATRLMGEFGNIASGALMGFAVGGPVGSAIGGGVAAITSLVGVLGEGDDAARESADAIADYASTLDEATGAVTELTRAKIFDRLESDGTIEATQQLGLSTEALIDAIAGAPGAAEELQRQLDGLRTTYTGVEGEARSLDDMLSGDDPLVDRYQAAADAQAQYGHLLPVLDEVEGAFGAESKALQESADRTRLKADATGLATGATEAHTFATDADTTAIEDNIKAMEDQRAEALKAIDAEYAYQAALLDVKNRLAERKQLLKELREAETPEERARLREQLEEYTLTLDKDTEAGQANWKVLREQITAWNDLSVSQQNAKGAYREARQNLKEAAREFGATKKEAREYADTLLDIPLTRITEVEVDGISEVEKELARLARDRRIKLTLDLTSQGYRAPGIQQADGGVVDYYAGGGIRENHVAQIAPAGAWRVWAEEETGGEAYIPLAQSKRARSLDIWREVGSRLGARFLEYAEGGFYGRPASAPMAAPVAATATPVGLSDRDRALIENATFVLQDMRQVDRHMENVSRSAAIGGTRRAGRGR